MDEQKTERATYWEGMIRDQAGSGATVRAFCREHQLSEHGFYWWRRRLSGTAPRRRSRAGQEFVEVVAAGQSAGPGWSGVALQLDERVRILVERGFDAETLRSVLGALAVGAGPCSH
jgi:hypothetical protein